MRKIKQVERDFRDIYKKEFGRELDVFVEYNPRLASAWARVCYQRSNGKLERIECSTMLLKAGTERYQDTIRHELIHAMLLEDKGVKGSGHGADFIKEAKRRGVSCEGYKEKRLGKGEKHKAVCTFCGQELLEGRNKAKMDQFVKKLGYLLCSCGEGSASVTVPAVVKNSEGVQQYRWEIPGRALTDAREKYWADGKRMQEIREYAETLGLVMKN